MSGPEAESPFRPEHFRRMDEEDDEVFYSEPRLVNHIDDAAIASASGFYAAQLPAGGSILDLMSSWVSHLTMAERYASVTGLGMNSTELERNPVLSRSVVHDLNRDPQLPFEDGEFDGAVCTVSVQYLTSPVEVVQDVGRVLAPGAPMIFTYSNRCFPTKAVAAWQMLDLRERADLIGLYFRLAGGFEEPEAYDLSPAPGGSDPLIAVMSRRAGG